MSAYNLSVCVTSLYALPLCIALLSLCCKYDRGSFIFIEIILLTASKNWIATRKERSGYFDQFNDFHLRLRFSCFAWIFYGDAQIAKY